MPERDRPEGSFIRSPEDIYEAVEDCPEMQLQETAYSCGAACGVQLLKDFGINDFDQRDVRDVRKVSGHVEEGPVGKIRGVQASHLANGLEDLILSLWSFRDIGMKDIDGGSLYMGDMNELEEIRKPEFWDYFLKEFWICPIIVQQRNHFVLLDEFDEHERIITLRDPWGRKGPEESECGIRATLRLDSFAEAWEAGHLNYVAARKP